uniref:Uncharacterized protein n=1 Tax=Amphimedon queenslandica TaxID=400682 RepID=A0A1X7TA99_AMPQE
MAECSSSTDSLSPAASDIENDDLSSTVLPYQYEPEGSEVDSEDSPDDENEMRLTIQTGAYVETAEQCLLLKKVFVAVK